MTVMTNVVLVLKDSEGNIGIVKTLTDNDIIKIANAITDVGQVVDPATHMPIEATTASVGVVQLATAQDITNGTAGKVVDAKELINFAQTLPAVNGVTDVSSGDNSNQLVVSRIGGSKTLTIDNVEHADNADEATHATQADTATSANSVAWGNVSGKPSTFAPATHNHDDRYYTESEIDTKLGGKANSSHTHDDRYYTESEVDTKLSGKSDTTHNHNSAYLGITAKAESAKSADSVAWSNVSGRPTKVSQFTNDSNYLTGITKAMVTNALGYTPPTSDTNTWNALKGSTTSAAGTAGYAPAPAAGAANRYLRCDGTWQVPPDNNTTYSKLSQFTNDSGYITSSGSCKYATSAGNGVPVGSVFYFASGSVPSGYLVCNGAAVSRTTYANLFNIVGTKFGSGNGSTTFNVPNLIDRFIQGNSTVGTSKSAGLPNITGSMGIGDMGGISYVLAAGLNETGALGRKGNTTVVSYATETLRGDAMGYGASINASYSSSIYGNSSTVQPPALTLLPCIKY